MISLNTRSGDLEFPFDIQDNVNDSQKGYKRSWLSDPIRNRIESPDVFENCTIRELILPIFEKKKLVTMSQVSKKFRKYIKSEFIRRLNDRTTFEQLKAAGKDLEIIMIINFLGEECLHLTKLDLRRGFSKIDDEDIKLISEKFANLSHLAVHDKVRGVTAASIDHFKKMTAIKNLVFLSDRRYDYPLNGFSFIEKYPNIENLTLGAGLFKLDFLKECTLLKNLELHIAKMYANRFLISNNESPLRLNECCPYLKSLYLNNFTNENLNFLDGCSLLENLRMECCNRLSDLASIGNCLALKKLRLSYGEFDNLNILKLKKLPHLEEISIYACGNLTDISCVEGCSLSLKLVDIRQSFRSENLNLTPLKQCKQLMGLDLTYCRVADITSLGNCINLEFLSLSFNSLLAEINSLSNLTKLKKLCLARTNVQDISPLRFCTALEELDLRGCNRLNRLIDICSLQNCHSLKKIIISSFENQDNEFCYQTLKFLFPETEIIVETINESIFAFDDMNEVMRLTDFANL
ncbi:MAG: leucine-rich repeat domain-containing protein [Candidatus Protochlamydia sp.]|nr:leucine-rich repeat domain-containing protein [Candidatus Protochlamydia sp.]